MATFTPPTTDQWTFAEGSGLDPSERRFWAHFGAQPRGTSVLKRNGVYVTVPYPTQEQLDACDLVVWPDGNRSPEYFLGGHEYQISEAQAAALEAAGYTVVSEVPVVPSGYSDIYTDIYA